MKLTNYAAHLLGSFLPVAKSYRSFGRNSFLSEILQFETETETDDMIRDLLEDREWEDGDSSIRFLSRRVEVTMSQQCIEDDANNTPAQTESEVEEQQALLEILGMKGCETNSQNQETFTLYNTLDLSNCPDELALLSAACEADNNFQSLIFRPLIANCTGFTTVPMDANTTALVQVTLNRHWEKGGVCLPKSCPSDANDLTAEDIEFMFDDVMPGNVSCTVKYLEADSDDAVVLEQTEDDSDAAVVMEQEEEDSDDAVVLEQEEDDSGATTAQLLFSSSASIGLVTASVALLMMW